MAVAVEESAVQITRHLFTADEYQRMGEVGIFHEDDRVELIHGEIVEMSPIGGTHVVCVNRTTRAAMRQTDETEFYVSVQNPIRIPNRRSEPQPDLAIVRVGYDEQKLPEASDVVIIVEVSDSTLDYDRSVKLPLYAAAGIPEAWLMNLVRARIERHTDPQPDGYRTIAYAERGQRLASTVLPDFTFDADELLGVNPAR